MARKIILLSDGTGNSSARIWRTNVWRVFEALDLTSSEQVAYYDDGVGTSSFKPLAMLGGAFGFGLKRNVIDLYKFACRNYRSPDDQIFAFGFSRGAFTIRVVIGLILDQGIIDARKIDDQELGRQAALAYRRYRGALFHTNWQGILRAIRRLFRRQPAAAAPSKPVGTIQAPRIRFVGLWDTVAAYGLPIDEMTQGFSQWIWPLEIPNHTLHPAVKRACHALALDDERTTFHPVLWNERAEAPPLVAGDNCFTRDERISQVWFTGMHANVGGGYPDDSLARIPLYWIMEEGRECGLAFKHPPGAEPDMVAQTRSAQDKDGRLYNSRSGFGSYYRYGPRKVAELCRQKFWNGDEVYVPHPKVHASVLERIKNNAHVYAPTGLPEHYEVVSAVPVGDRVLFKITPAEHNSYESPHAACARADLQAATIGNLIALRAFIYLLTVLLTFAFVIFPISGQPDPIAEMTSPLRWFSDLIRLAGAFLPGFSSRWINGYAQAPGSVLMFIVGFVVLTGLSKRVAESISLRMSAAWKQSLAHTPVAARPSREDTGYRLRTTVIGPLVRAWKYWLAPALSALLIVYVAASFGSHALYNMQDVAGFTCQPSKETRPAGTKGAIVRFRASELCHATGLTLLQGQRYRIRINPDAPQLAEYSDAVVLPSTCEATASASLANGSVSTDERGYTTFPSDDKQSLDVLQSAVHVLLLPFRRILDRAWFQVVVRYGSVGGEERYLDPDAVRRDRPIEARLAPPFNAELFLFLNDAAFGIPGLYDLFYRDNKGCVTALVVLP